MFQLWSWSKSLLHEPFNTGFSFVPLAISITLAIQIFWTALPVIPILISYVWSAAPAGIFLRTRATSLKGILTPGPSPYIVFLICAWTSALYVKKSNINRGSAILIFRSATAALAG